MMSRAMTVLSRMWRVWMAVWPIVVAMLIVEEYGLVLEEYTVAAMWVGAFLLMAFNALLNLREDREEWTRYELSVVREIYGLGCVVMPSDRGGYALYDQDGILWRWFDHWWEVEEYAVSHRPIPDNVYPGSGD